jgi:hypothetical protein
LWESDALTLEQRAQLKHAEAILYDALEEDESPSEGRTIPIPEDALTEEAADLLMQHLDP